MNNNNHLSDEQKHAARYRYALTQTVSDESFNERGINELADSLAEQNITETQTSDDIKQILLETLESDQLTDKFVDFYPEDQDQSFSRETETTDEDWNTDNADQFSTIDALSANDRLEDNYVPGRYKVKSLIGKGATGQVFSVVDNNLERSVAVKFMHPSSMLQQGKTEQFIEEAKKTAQLNHPNILPIHDLDFTDGALPFFSMRKFDGLTLEEIITQSKHNPHITISNNIKKVGILIKICEAVSYAHSKSIIHGDIKPGNIMVGRHGDVMLLDWGACFHESERGKSDRTIIGTPMYMSPEQARKEDCGKQSDIYCIGTTLLHLLTLRYPLYNSNPRLFWEMKKEGFYQEPNATESSTIPRPLLSIIRKALHPRTEERYTSVDLLRRDLIAFQGGDPVSAHKDSTWAFIKRLYQKNKTATLITFSSIIILVLIGFMIYIEKLKELSQWHEVYNENFDHYTHNDIAQNWQAVYFPAWSKDNRQDVNLYKDNSWFVKQGSLHSKRPYPSFKGSRDISPNIKISGPMKFSVELNADTSRPLSNVFIGGRTRFDGYTFHVGDWGGRNKITLTKGSSMIPLQFGTIPAGVQKGQPCHYVVEKNNNIIRFFIQGELVIEYIDPMPLSGEQHKYFGFEMNQASIDNITAWNKPLPEKIKAIALPDHYYSAGKFELALHAYDEIRRDSGDDSETSALALLRSAQCLLNLQRYNGARVRLLSFLSKYTEHVHTLDAMMILANTYIAMADTENMEKYLNIIGQRFHQDQRTRWLFEKAVDYYAASINLHENSYIEPGIYGKAKDMAVRVNRIESFIGYKISEFSSLEKSRCAYTLFRLGYRDDLLQHFPTSKYSIRHRSRIKDFAYFKHNRPNSNVYISMLIHAERFDEILNRTDTTDLSPYSFWGDPELLRRFITAAQQHPGDHQRLINRCENRIEKLTPYWDNIKPHILNGEFEAAYAILTDKNLVGVEWTHSLLYNYIGKEEMIINDEDTQTDGVAAILARAVQAIKAWDAGDRRRCLQLLEQLEQYHGDYYGKVISCCAIKPFFTWLENRDIDTMISSLRFTMDKVKGRYADKIFHQLQFLAGDIDFETMVRNPANHTGSGRPYQFLYVLKGIRHEMDGDIDQALAAYARVDCPLTNYDNSDAYMLARSREKALKD